jgi:hypothetical protein
VNLGLLSQSPEAPQSAAWDDAQETGAQLLELRTASGPVYVRPTRWQRIRLQWAFRHFHELPLQVLSRRDQRLIEKLSQSAVVTPALPVTGTSVFGVVENLSPKAPSAPTRVVTMQPQSAPKKPFRPIPWNPAVLKPDFSQRSKEREMKQIFGTAKSRDVRDMPFRQWGALGALATTCVTVIVASLYGILPHPTTAPVNSARALPAPAHTPSNIKQPVTLTPTYVSPSTLVAYAKPKHQFAPPPTEPALAHNELASLANENGKPTNATRANAVPVPPRTTVPDTIVEQNSITPAPTNVPLLVSELPQGHFAHPVVSRPNLVGELQLKALIGPDGLVKDVTVVSGDPKLAEAGMRAVRQWHYAPYQVQGNPVEVETQIKMNFFGEDAVSVASVASVPSPHYQPISAKPND